MRTLWMAQVGKASSKAIHADTHKNMHFDSDLIQRLTQQDSAGKTEADI